jgi:preprotein translocase subunit YajC
MLYALYLFADGAKEVVKDAAKDGDQPGGLMEIFGRNPLLPILALVAMFFLIVVMPQRRREQKQKEALMSGMKKNDEVITASGIIGVVHSIKEGGDEVTLKIDDNAKIRVLRSTIVRIVTKETKDGAIKSGLPPA